MRCTFNDVQENYWTVCYGDNKIRACADDSIAAGNWVRLQLICVAISSLKSIHVFHAKSYVNNLKTVSLPTRDMSRLYARAVALLQLICWVIYILSRNLSTSDSQN
jgi:hypothetical protein